MDNSWIYNDIVVYDNLKGFLLLTQAVYSPIRYDGYTPVYSKNDIDLYGLPDHYGVYSYLVIDDTGPIYATDYKFEQTRSLRPIHRYSRLLRFRTTLFEILGARSNVPLVLLKDLEGMYDLNPEKVWDSIRGLLKLWNQTKYVNMIPSILKYHKYESPDFPDRETLLGIELQFMGMCEKFKYLESPRKYFPNIRFVCVKLLEMNGYRFTYRIPKIRTPRKKNPMDLIFDLLID